MHIPALLQFLSGLAENNNRPWFLHNKPNYDILREEFTELVAEIIQRIARFDERIEHVDPKKSLFRIYRDVRFSHNKEPYKTQFSAMIGEKKDHKSVPGYYFQINHEGVLGMGSWNSKTSPGAKAYFDAHTKKFGGKEPDRWASGACWAGLEILTNAVKAQGLDRKAIRDYVANTTHKTIMGDIRFVGSENVGTPGTVSQWQNGEFEVVWPPKQATAKLIANKPAWK